MMPDAMHRIHELLAHMIVGKRSDTLLVLGFSADEATVALDCPGLAFVR
jgi:hypothetical protein